MWNMQKRKRTDVKTNEWKHYISLINAWNTIEYYLYISALHISITTLWVLPKGQRKCKIYHYQMIHLSCNVVTMMSDWTCSTSCLVEWEWETHLFPPCQMPSAPTWTWGKYLLGGLLRSALAHTHSVWMARSSTPAVSLHRVQRLVWVWPVFAC